MTLEAEMARGAELLKEKDRAADFDPWETPPFGVACPFCFAPQGEECRTTNHLQVIHLRRADSHVARVRLSEVFRGEDRRGHP